MTSSENLVKIRLSNCRQIKPFWANPDDINSVFKELNHFVNKYFNRFTKVRFDEFNNQILLYQVMPIKVPGFSIKEQRKKIVKNPFPRKYRKLFRNKYQRHIVINTQVNELAEKGIYPIPIPRIIKYAKKLEDPSGINPINKDEITSIFIKYIFGQYLTNSVNYANNIDGMDINFEFNKKSVTPTEFMELFFEMLHNMCRTQREEVQMLRPMSNTAEMYKSLRNKEFVKCYISTEEHAREVPMDIHHDYPLVDELKAFIKETGIPKESKITISVYLL